MSRGHFNYILLRHDIIHAYSLLDSQLFLLFLNIKFTSSSIIGTILKAIYALKAQSMNQTGRTFKKQRNTPIKYVAYNRSKVAIPLCLLFKSNSSSTSYFVKRHVAQAFLPF